jgi:sarcosine oxidase
MQTNNLSLIKLSAEHFDAIVVGGGSMGAATAYHLAQRGANVLVLEQFDFIHENGAHGGQSRIIRKAYFEHPDYVPLLLRAYQNWAALEEKTGEQVYFETGIIYFGAKGDELLENTKASARQFDLKLDILAIEDAKRRYPMFSEIPDDWQCLFEPEAGYLLVEKCVRLMLQEAIKMGAVAKARAQVLSWKTSGDGVEVHTEKGTFTADKVIFTAGAWTNQLLSTLNIPLKITRQILGWVRPNDWKAFSEGFPCWFVSDSEQGLYYGMPIIENESASGALGLKLGAHHHGEVVHPDRVNRNISAADEADFRYALEKYIPSANGDTLAVKTCLYANSPDEHFIIDVLPEEERVIFACGFSGHGFKFASVVGEALADLALNGKTDLPIGFLGLHRF